ncbi:MAG TPA: Hsp20/alpha crystallin family protein [Arsenicitalea sp.]|jgi:HSP20 family protein|nr:Hsp20/alpha crystallin family protein [Arsenicitalea sp.]
MQVSDYRPWRNLGLWADREPRQTDPNDPVSVLQAEVDRAFENFWSAMPIPFFNNSMWPLVVNPDIDVVDDGKTVTVKAELPGFKESEVDVSMTSDSLIIRAQRSPDTDGRRSGRRRRRTPEQIEHVVPLPQGLDPDGVSASFNDGVLTVVLPRTAEAQAEIRRVPVKAT